jgi:hypothetical protein
MSSWIRPSSCALLALLVLSPLRAADLDGSPPDVGNAEAARLYQDADAYVTKVTEGTYSYLYMQFFWKRAESFVERAQRVYPDSPTGRALLAGQLKVGPYSLDYFKGRVLPKLEEKRTYTVDAVSCAIFLYNRDPQRWDRERQAALEGILEVLARQQRWGEALAFPVGSHRDILLRSIFRVAARYDEQKEVTQLLRDTKKAEQAAAGFAPIQGEALALLGKPRADIVRFLRAHPEDEVKLAVLHGMIEREVQIRRSAALKVAIQATIATTHFDLRNLKVRDNVDAVARQFFPEGNAKAAELMLAYRAALGTPPPVSAPLEAHLAYLEYLAAFERFDEVESYDARVDETLRPAIDLKAIELLAVAGRLPEAERRRALYVDGDPARSDAAVYAQFRGQIESTDDVLTVHEKTFAELPIKDPCILAQAITEEALEPNQSIRGATPWDAVVFKFDPGFDHLAAPKSRAVGAAASATNPY